MRLDISFFLSSFSTYFVFSPKLSSSVSPLSYFLSSSLQTITAELWANNQNVCVCVLELCQPEPAELQL